MNIQRTFMLVGMACLIALPGLEASEIRRLSGKVQIQRGGTDLWVAARPRAVLRKGDNLRTAAGGRAELQTKGGHLLAVRPNTTLQVLTTSAAVNEIKVLLGRVRATVRKLRVREKFEVRTPLAVAAVRGTVFEMDVAANASSRLSVLEGVVDFRDLEGAGQDLQVLKGQSVLIEPGAAPRPPEPIPQEILQQQESRRPDLSPQKTELLADIEQEQFVDDHREKFQQEAVLGLKEEEYQQGRAAVDAFGRRVRVEEFVIRPAPDDYSHVVLNQRQGRVDFAQLDVHASGPLPLDLGSVNLFHKEGDTMQLYAVNTHYLAFNGGDYYREWKSGGMPVLFTAPRGDHSDVVFAHWFVEVKGAGQDPVLLSHWVPNPDYAGGGFTATFSRDMADYSADGSLDIPFGYDVFNNNKTGGNTIGDDRTVDGLSSEERLNYFGADPVFMAYNQSEGYNRDSKGFLDGKAIDSNTSVDDYNAAFRFTRHHDYMEPETTTPLHQVKSESFRLTDLGQPLTRLQAGDFESLTGHLNVEEIIESSIFGHRSIDLVSSPLFHKNRGPADAEGTNIPE